MNSSSMTKVHHEGARQRGLSGYGDARLVFGPFLDGVKPVGWARSAAESVECAAPDFSETVKCSGVNS